MDRDEFEGPQQGHMGGPSMAFGPESRRVAREATSAAEAAQMVASSTRRASMSEGSIGSACSASAIRQAPPVPYSGGLVVSIRRLANGWVVDDGRGMEMVATCALEASAIARDWMVQVERSQAAQRDPGRLGGEVGSPRSGGPAFWPR